MAHQYSIGDDDEEYGVDTEPSSPHLSREDTIKHFPADFDCSQLLFTGEKILWAQRVPPLRRYLPQTLFWIIIRYILLLGIVIFLYVVAMDLEANTPYGSAARNEYITASVMFFLLTIVLLHKEFGGTRVDVATNFRVFKAVINRTDAYTDTLSYNCIESITKVWNATNTPPNVL